MPSATLGAAELLRAVIRPLEVARAERAIEAILGAPNAVLFASARGGLSAALAATGQHGPAGIPAYTCAAVANAALSAGRETVFTDVDERGLVPAGAWPEHVLPVVQDTYGFVAELPVGRPFVRDAAHRADLIGRAGEAPVTVTSFEHSKWLSTGQGGLAVTADGALAARMRELRDAHPAPPDRLRHAAVTLATLVAARLRWRGYPHLADPILRRVARADAVRAEGQSGAELAGHGVEPRLLGPPTRTVARLGCTQLGRLDAVALHRRRMVELYDRAAGVERPAEPLLRYPLRVEDPAAFEGAMLEAGWDLRGRWFSSVLHPAGSDPAAFGYRPGSAPAGERLVATVVNLPTHPLVGEREARELIALALEAGARPLV